MDIKNLTKEQKQAMILIVMLSIAGVYALIRFALQPSLETFRKASEELETYRNKLEQAERLTGLEAEIREGLQESMKKLVEYDDRYMPPTVNGLSWATETIYQNARNVGVEVESVAQVRGNMVPWGKSQKIERVFVPFVVRVTTSCSFFELVRLIDEIQASNPYVSISDIQISAQSRNVEQHRIQIEVEWPIWKDESAEEWIKGVPSVATATEG